MNVDSPLILALDSTDVKRCSQLISQTRDSIAIYKLGLEFYLMNGASGVQLIKSAFPDIRIFLDLKLHDIPNTVGAAAKSVAELKPEILTVHASGGSAMVGAACRALPDTTIAAVTILTSLGESDLLAFGAKPISKIVEDLAIQAVAAGARAIVASPQELIILRSAIGQRAKLITPGIRPNGSATDDQVRTTSPKDAIAAGADYLVIGRPITGASDPGEAARVILRSI